MCVRSGYSKEMKYKRKITTLSILLAIGILIVFVVLNLFAHASWMTTHPIHGNASWANRANIYGVLVLFLLGCCVYVLIILAITITKSIQAKRSLARCSTCGYDMSGLLVCPECGKDA